MSKNPFALLADDGDVSDSEQVLKPSKPVAVDAAPQNTKGESAPQPTARRSIPGHTTKPQKELKELPASDAPAGDKDQFEGERGRDDRGTGFGRGRGRGERGARGGDRGSGGERGGQRGGRGSRGGARLDRRSQTGRTDSEKAEHQGWGGDEGKRELEAETAGVTDAAVEQGWGVETAGATDAPVGQGWGADVSATPAPAENEAAPAVESAAAEPLKVQAEPEDNSKTYEEYQKEQRAAGRGVLENLSLGQRKANEGADDSQWKDGVLLSKGKATTADEAYFTSLEKAKAAKKTKERKEKTLLEVEFTAPARQGSDRSDRGGRGGTPRGARGGGAGRGRGDRSPRERSAPTRAPRGGRGGAEANGINVSDEAAFPSLA